MNWIPGVVVMVSAFIAGWFARGVWGMRDVWELIHEAQATNRMAERMQADARKNLADSKRLLELSRGTRPQTKDLQ